LIEISGDENSGTQFLFLVSIFLRATMDAATAATGVPAVPLMGLALAAPLQQGGLDINRHRNLRTPPNATRKRLC